MQSLPKPNDGHAGTPNPAGQASEVSAEESKKPATIQGVKMGIPLDLPRLARPVIQRQILAIADCENDTSSVAATLRYAGILGKQGKLKSRVCGVSVVQTGDLLHKNFPSPDVVRFWQDLRSATAMEDCSLTLIAGNHELEIWRRLEDGEHLGIKRREQGEVRALIRTMRLFHVEGSVLFLHGYPTVKLLRHMQAYRIGTGNDLNDYNKDCFQAAFDNPKLLARYAYPRRNACRGCLLHDVPDPERYYHRHGIEVAALLKSLGIDLVVHGHRPERTGVQRDYEVQRYLPGVRMINHDVQLRLHGLGATVIRQVENGPMDLILVNRTNAKPSLRADVRHLLRAPAQPAKAQPGFKAMGLDGKLAGFIHDRDLIAPGIIAANRR